MQIETASAIFMIPYGLTQAQYDAQIKSMFPAVADLVLAQYPAADFATPRDALVAVTTDAQFVCPSRLYARAAASSQTEPVYRYFFTHTLTGPMYSLQGAARGLELFFVF